MTRNDIEQLLAAHKNAEQLLAAQRNHKEIEARIMARVDAEIARRAEQDRIASNDIARHHNGGVA